MNTKLITTVLFATALTLTSFAALAQGQGSGGNRGADAQERAQVERGQRDFDRDRVRDHKRMGAAQHDRDRIKDRTKAPDQANLSEHQIYGYNLMSDEERDAYRERVMKAETRQEREQIEAQHRHEMQIRAKNRNVDIDDAGNPIEE